ncbi:MAG: efflux RND transporter periplasmic adaptor subunit [Alphaproteobacteria bacterium]|nr:efflux RND transporter periplasmic adaptor subunit [Alphaproteobacteria bacterium]MBQ7949741.1 efflux RND transporter periplasmic adaptor subunit [Alphaproteobacteria bacterium]
MKNKQTKNKKSSKRILKYGVFALAIIGTIAVFSGGGDEKRNYITINITRGDLSYTVSATGEIQPVNTVNVGSQVSGTIDNLYVDFNSNVKKGDILLTIEPSVLQASVDEAMASLTSAKSQRDFAFSEYKRNKTLYNDGFISRAEMEQSETTYNQAEQSVKKAQSTYDRAVTNLSYATITSPVDGTVISRKVDVGQTVAASFSTPDLFEIAEDLTKMQIETSVSEADIGVIREGQPVTFTVDAYPTDIFNGTVRQVRLSPTTTSNVVVYTVVIDVDNSDMRLMPGMTAFVTVIINSAENVYKAQNAAFLIRNFKSIDPTLDETITPDTHLAIMRDGEIQFIEYKKGLESATETQIISDQIMDGDRIVVGVQGQTSNTTQNSNNRGGPMGGPGGGGPMGGPM